VPPEIYDDPHRTLAINADLILEAMIFSVNAGDRFVLKSGVEYLMREGTPDWYWAVETVKLTRINERHRESRRRVALRYMQYCLHGGCGGMIPFPGPDYCPLHAVSSAMYPTRHDPFYRPITAA